MTTDAVGGVWQYSERLSRELARRGHEITLAVVGPEPSAAQRLDIAATDGIHVAVFPAKLEWMPDSYADTRRTGDWLLMLEDRHRTDVVHINGFCHGALPWRSPTLVVAHSCVRSWWRACHRSDPPPEWDGYVRRVVRGLRAASLVVAPTAAFLAQIEALYGPLGPSRVITNGGDPAFRPRSKRAYALAIGRIWDRAKNFERLDRIAGRAAWPVVLAGDAVDPTTGAERLPQSARYLGRLPQKTLARWLGHAGIFVHPAIYEPFGLAALEAACAGCALVLADIPTLRELWGGAAVFFDPHADDDLLSTLDALAANAGRRAALAARAQRQARRFGIGRMAAAYEDAYRNLLSVPIAGRLGARHGLGIAPRPSLDGAGDGPRPFRSAT